MAADAWAVLLVLSIDEPPAVPLAVVEAIVPALLGLAVPLDALCMDLTSCARRLLPDPDTDIDILTLADIDIACVGQWPTDPKRWLFFPRFNSRKPGEARIGKNDAQAGARL